MDPHRAAPAAVWQALGAVLLCCAAAALAAACGAPRLLCCAARLAAKRHHHSLWSCVITLLHWGDPLPPADSCASLRLLWFKALAAAAGDLEDNIAWDLLPPATRYAVRWPARVLWGPLLPYQPAIVHCARFLDKAVESEICRISAGGSGVVVVSVGAGSGTRSLRALQAAEQCGVRARAVEIDRGADWRERRAVQLQRLAGRRSDLRGAAARVTLVAADLDACAPTFPALVGKVGADEGVLVVLEGVMCYLHPRSAAALLRSVLDPALRCRGLAYADTLPVAPPAGCRAPCSRGYRRCSYACSATCAEAAAPEQWRRAMAAAGWVVQSHHRAPRGKVKHCGVAEPCCAAPAAPLSPSSPLTAIEDSPGQTPEESEADSSRS
eukprot:TRINITY_DN13633_c0_g1_i1.p1 TRINITY_DN13633_c0_g1~~TRINITY_DN13633_c0_g1_i1.p1  ORF type:complete len:382 (+),score=77.14 TRINITY_DN13633_c0_g1_i1:98-1243(+)